jgi:hypothetical protein
MPQYYLAESGQRRGPFPLEQLPAQGLTADTLVWTEGMPQWQRADEVIELRPYLPTPPQSYEIPTPEYAPPPNQPIGYHGVAPYYRPSHNGMAIAGFVCSFFVPLLGLIFSWVALAGMGRTGNEEGKGLAIAGLIISIVLLALGLLYCAGVMTCLGLPFLR